MISALFLYHQVQLRDEYFKNFLFPELSFRFSLFPLGDLKDYAFISTSTPEGRSSLLRASTVLEDEVYISNNLLCVHN